MIIDYITNESINEQLLDEQIPRDLLAAYRNSIPAPRGVVGNPNSWHGELENPERSQVRYDYGKANYEVLSAQEALDYLAIEEKDDGTFKCTNKNIFNANLQNLRFIVNGNLLEYGINDKGQMYYTYWAYIPQAKMDAEGLELKDGTTDSKWVKTITQLGHVIKLADKIYKTDEYQHFITRNTDELHDKRRNKVYFRKAEHPIPGADVIHKPYANLGRNVEFTDSEGNKKTEFNAFIDPDQVDIGKHSNTYSLSRVRSSDNLIPSYDFNANLSNLNVLSDRCKNLFVKYDSYRRALKNLEKYRDQYDEDYYNEKHQYWTDKLKEAEEAYRNERNNFKDLKSKIFLRLPKVFEEKNKNLVSLLYTAQSLMDTIYNTETRISNQLSMNLLDNNSNSNLRSYNNKLNDLLDKLKILKAEAQAETDAIQNDQSELASDTEHSKDLTDATENEIISYIDMLNNTANEITAKHSQELTRLETELARLKQALLDLTPKKAEARKIQKEQERQNIEAKWNSKLDSILDFA